MSDDQGRPVPPHGSGGMIIFGPKPTCLDTRNGDPDDTEGRALYRRLADKQARMDTALGRVRLKDPQS